jgi:predicted DNA-binding transcriptional regulator YafY
VSVGASDRLSRLLALVPWLLHRQGVPIAEAARQFGITETQLVKDLELLFVCGTPGHLPDDLIAAEWESGHVYLDNAEPIARPLRLGLDEAVTLLVGLRTLAEVPGLHDREAVESALAKLSAAAGDAASAAAAVSVDLTAGAQEQMLAVLREALAGRRRLRLRYLVPARDETTEREVDPMRLSSVGRRWYLEAWCHRAEAVRVFRIDRMVCAELLDQDGTPPPGTVGRDLTEQLFLHSADDTLVVLDLHPSARWVAEYYPVETMTELPGGLRVQLYAADPRWVARLALRLGGGVSIASPGWLADQASSAARDALALYPSAG